MPTSTAGKSNNRGFTLIELTIVIALLGLFALVALPLLGNFGESGLKRSARQLAGVTRHLFNEAALTGKEHRLVFDPGNGSYRALLRENNGELVATGKRNKMELAAGVRFRDIQQPGSGTGGGEVITRIYPVGWMQETVLHLTDAAGEVMTLRLMPFTGTTEIYTEYREF
ncbi:MAG: prepilin-type N-terminal cleavage/methylation domain-containing protein [Desulfuromonadaceae bacterium]|nr:prepilin-type N-terminal cleavage/methylation domain-containing protein [Desulfuromonadaceae bacterium]